MRISKKAFQGLTIKRLDAGRSHAIAGAMARIYFQLSEPPPLGWSYTFTTIWQSLTYPSKCQAGVESDTIWIECVPEEVATYHFGQLEDAVAQTNAMFRQRAQEQAFLAGRNAQSDAELQARLEDLSRTLYPVDELAGDSSEPERLWGSLFLARLRRAFFRA